MKFCIKNVYLIFFLMFSLSYSTGTLGKDIKIQYSKDNISNYFSGIVSANYNSTNNAFKHLNEVKFLKTRHSNYNIQFLRTLILLNKFEEAFSFSKSVWNEKEFFFEADIILGLNYFINKDYPRAEKHFERLNVISEYILLINISYHYFLNFSIAILCSLLIEDCIKCLASNFKVFFRVFLTA